MGPSRAAATATAGKKQAGLKPPGYKRLLVIFTAVAYVLFLGVPVWWHTTSLHRPPLPHDAMQQVALEASSSTAYLPVSLQLVVAFPEGQGHVVTPELAAAFHASLQAAAAAALPCTVNLSVTIDSAEGRCYHHPPAAAAASAVCAVDWPAGAAHTTNSDIRQQKLLLDDWLQQQQGQGQGGHNNAPGHYRLYLLPSVAAEGSATAADGVQAETSHTLVVGRHRHAWLTYKPSRSAASQMQELQALAAAAAVRALSCCFALHAGQTGLTSAGSLPISPAGRTHLSLSLLNADPAAGSHYTWDMEQWEAQHLAPIAASLAPVSQISLESQVLQYTAARLPGTWSAKHGAYVVTGSQLPFFIDSEWPLESGRAVTPQLGGGLGVSPALTGGAGGAAAAGSGSEAGGQAAGMKGAALVAPHVLQFLVYIPSQQWQPLQLLGHGGQTRDSNSFVIPSWGGLMVLNPDQDSSSSSNRDTGADSDSGRDSITDDNSSSNTVKSHAAAVPLTAEQYGNITAVLIAQLQALFGVAPLEDSNSSGGSGQQGQPGTTLKVEHLPGGRRGFSRWQMDALLRQRSAHDVREAARVLAALSTLVQELPNLEMPDLISEQVTGALSEIDKAWQQTAAGDYLAAAAAATAAHAAAEAAFAHPAVLAQLNFPESHKLGVYMPLFLPLCVPLIQGLMGQLKHFCERRRVYALSIASR